LRHSLERLQEGEEPAGEEGHVTRDKTQRDRPVEGGFTLQYEQIPEEEDNSMKTSEGVTDDELNRAAHNNENEEMVEVRRLRSNIKMCMESIDFTKKLIEEYIKVFEMTIAEIGDEGNELFKRHFD
jgi:hypothetical protein